VLERMAQNVRESCAEPDGRGIEISWGAAELAPGASPEDVLAEADLALLENKTEKRR
jgi:PleD family two-component response regulator